MIQSLIYSACKIYKNIELLIVADQAEAEEAGEVMLFAKKSPFLLSDFRAKMGDDLRPYYHELLILLAHLRNYYKSQSPSKILIAPFNALLYPLPQQKNLEGFSLTYQKITIKDIQERLYHYGYTFVDMIEMQGEASLRGDILDIYPPLSEKPLRISFFDDEIEDIRYFDIYTQLSEKEKLNGIYIPPALFALSADEFEDINKSIIQSSSASFSQDMLSLGFWHLKPSMCSYIHDSKISFITPQAYKDMQEYISIAEGAHEVAILQQLAKIPQLEVQKGYADFTFNAHRLNTFLQLHSKKTIHIIARNDAILRQTTLPQIPYNTIFAPYHLNFITPDEVIISLNKNIAPKKIHKKNIILDEIRVGDYIVHEEYGIGIFQGISQEKVLGALRDFILIAYQGEDKLLLPVENLNYIDRYIADSGSIPVIDQLGSSSFVKLKEKIKKKLLEIAQQIVLLAAQRNITPGIIFDVHNEEIPIFQSRSGFEYTDDQKQAINNIFNDLSSGKVMDRLLSGDVGFGKTEVAMNALFVAYKSGFQSALLVPTTLLAMQHFKTLKERFSPFGIKIVQLDRFVSNKEKKSIIKNVQEGLIDIVVGTHSIINMQFHKIGLIIIDEEHKFGVKQKERIKQIAIHLHTLTMSATPIPRTLNQVLSDIKPLSTLSTPPQKRKPIRTFVKAYSDTLIKEVILREIRRGGQIFYIHNNIASINNVYTHLKSLIPHLHIAILHSQIDSKESENIMIDFCCNKYHVLLSTSIVESGIHLPNANTIIINSSDKFGMADLHQLRGRVGRGEKEGFCYFLINDHETLTPEAKKRLLALETHSELGSGSILAFHDLEIRGGGNLLGEAQSGHIKNIGYGLYLKMLEDSICSLSTQTQNVNQEVDIKLSINAFLSPQYISSERIRINLYRRLALCKSIDEINHLEIEMNDRFGKADHYTKQFFALITIKVLAQQLHIQKITNYQQKISICSQAETIKLEAYSKDDDDILDALLKYLHKQSQKQKEHI